MFLVCKSVNNTWEVTAILESYETHKCTVSTTCKTFNNKTCGKDKGKGHRCTGTEALYGPYGP